MLSGRLNKHKLDTQKQFSSGSFTDKYCASLPERTREHFIYSKDWEKWRVEKIRVAGPNLPPDKKNKNHTAEIWLIDKIWYSVKWLYDRTSFSGLDTISSVICLCWKVFHLKEKLYFADNLFSPHIGVFPECAPPTHTHTIKKQIRSSVEGIKVRLKPTQHSPLMEEIPRWHCWYFPWPWQEGLLTPT